MSKLRDAFYRSQQGSAFGIFFIFILILFLIFMGDMAFIMFSQCEGENPVECIIDQIFAEDEEEEVPEGSVTAAGSISGEFKGKTYSVTISLVIPLKGGEVTGSFEGDCDGSIKGSYAGGNGGVIEGKANGSCAFVFPASGNFSGSVNTASKTVPISGEGRTMGVSKQGSLTLSYSLSGSGQ
jgi:hypothetical protein